jgi:dihydrofolate synthase/folylpolyglutamate synthase
MASDETLVAAFNAVEAARGDTTLTYFEFTTLAIMKLLSEAGMDVVILEVGLGGRLDAVNIIDADVSIVTSVDIDHTDYLGDTREKIGFEKAGIFRAGKTAICSDPVPPQSLIDHAEAIGADLWLMGRDFNYSGDKQQWSYGGRGQRRNSLAYPSLRGANQILNACAALAALEALKLVLPVGAQEVRTGLVTVELPGRFQVLPGRPTTILDVAHNPHAAGAEPEPRQHGLPPLHLRRVRLHARQGYRWRDRRHVRAYRPLVPGHAAVAALGHASELAAKVQAVQPERDERTINVFDDPGAAYANAVSRAGEDDRIVVFGSFLTVAGVMAARKSSLH